MIYLVLSTNINCCVGIHSCSRCRKKDGLLPLATEVINPPGVLVRTIGHLVVGHQLMQYLHISKQWFFWILNKIYKTVVHKAGHLQNFQITSTNIGQYQYWLIAAWPEQMQKMQVAFMSRSNVGSWMQPNTDLLNTASVITSDDPLKCDSLDIES